MFDSSTSTHQVTVDIVQDNANELTESFSVKLEMDDSAREPGVLLIPGNAFVTILDDDSKPL